MVNLNPENESNFNHNKSTREKLVTYLAKLLRKDFPKDGVFHCADEFRIIHSGPMLYDLLLELIQNSTSTIVIQVYILKNDLYGQKILSALKNKAKSGVQVWLLVDGIGTNTNDELFDHFLNLKNFSFKIFNPRFSDTLRNFGRRAHQKIFLFDQKKLILGGFNIGKEYLSESKDCWLDYGAFIKSDNFQDLFSSLMQIFAEGSYFENYILTNSSQTIFENNGKSDFRILFQDGQNGKHFISKRINLALKKATQEIFILGSYFFPDQYFLHLLTRARKRGVKINLIISEKSDVPWAKWATEYILSSLFKHKINIYLVNDKILHAKSIIMDNNWMTLGSYNFHFTSQFFNLESNIETTDQKIISEFKNIIKDLAENKSTLLTGNYRFKSLPLWQKLRNFMAYQVGVLLFAYYSAKGRPDYSDFIA